MGQSQVERMIQVGDQVWHLLLWSLAGLGHLIQLQQNRVQPRTGPWMNWSVLCPWVDGEQAWEHLGSPSSHLTLCGRMGSEWSHTDLTP